MLEVLLKTLIDKHEKNALEEIVAKLIINGYLQEDFHFTPYSIISYILLTQKTRQLNDESEVMIELKLENKEFFVVKNKKKTSLINKIDSKRFKIDKNNSQNDNAIIEID